MKRLAALAVATLALSACAGEKVWMRSGSTANDASNDEVDCAAQAEGGGVSFNVGGGAELQTDRFSQRYACLRSRGYRLVPLTAEESGRLKSLGGMEKDNYWRQLLAKNGFGSQQPWTGAGAIGPLRRRNGRVFYFWISRIPETQQSNAPALRLRGIVMRKVVGVYDPPRGHWVGDGFPVRSLFSHFSHGDAISPFLLLDYAGPHEFEPAETPRGVDVHPHRGFETVTIVYDGEVDHHDSTGAGGRIGPGDVQWMTAASGILHREFHSPEFTRRGGRFEMAQLWVNLPAKDKSAAPGYQTLAAADIPTVELPDGAGRLRVIAGEHEGAKGPARTFTPIGALDIRLKEGGAVTLSPPAGHTVLAAVFEGPVQVNGETVRTAGLAALSRDGGEVRLEAGQGGKILLLTGEPIDEPVVARGPFVMNSEAEIAVAIADFRSGAFGSIPA